MKKKSKFRSVLQWIGKNKLLTLGIIIVGIYLLAGIFAPLIAPSDPGKANPSIRLLKPFSGSGTRLGTDAIGRDLFSRLLYGIRTSVRIGFCSVLLAALIGLIVGIISGLTSPGPLDSVLMRITDVQMGFPFIVLAMIALTLFAPNEGVGNHSAESGTVAGLCENGAVKCNTPEEHRLYRSGKTHGGELMEDIHEVYRQESDPCHASSHTA